jgi:hypothetical protein
MLVTGTIDLSPEETCGNIDCFLPVFGSRFVGLSAMNTLIGAAKGADIDFYVLYN